MKQKYILWLNKNRIIYCNKYLLGCLWIKVKKSESQKNLTTHNTQLKRKSNVISHQTSNNFIVNKQHIVN